MHAKLTKTRENTETDKTVLEFLLLGPKKRQKKKIFFTRALSSIHKYVYTHVAEGLAVPQPLWFYLSIIDEIFLFSAIFSIRLN